MKKSGFALLFSMIAALSLTAASARTEGRKDALIVSYQTPASARGLGGRYDLVRRLEARGFRLTVVSDRFPERADAIAPSPARFLEAFERLASDPEVRELAIFVDLHGVPRKKGERTHAVLFGDEELSLDTLRSGLRRLKKRGARVVLMDFSCYSGATLPLARDGACVASDGAKTSLNYPHFVDAFADAIRPETSFEEAFLEARRLHQTPRTPRISSDAGRVADGPNELLEKTFSQLSPSGALRYADRIANLEWIGGERAQVDESFKRWREGGEIRESSSIGSIPRPFQAAIRFLPLVRAERNLYERRYRATRAEIEASGAYERAASRSCAEFTF